MLLPSRHTARGALARMIFILVTVTNRGEGSYQRDNPSEQVNYKALYHKGHSDGTNDRTSQTIVQHKQQNSLPNNATVDHLVDNGDPEENGEVYVGYGRDPWGPSTLMGNDAGGSRGRGMSSQRPRRNVVHLYNMVSCATGCNPIIYKGYGCYCGFLGSGAPIDGIDRCCKMHDWCYNTANCPMFFEYLVPYFWKCYRHRPICAIDHGIYGGPGSCAQRLCECDRLLSECLSHYRCPKRRAVCHSSPVRFLIQSLIMF